MTPRRLEHQLDNLPRLFKQLMQGPVVPLRHGALPVTEALYVFYLEGEPISVGSPPHINQIDLLGPSVRLGLAFNRCHGPILDRFPQTRPQLIIHGRWLRVEDTEERKLLELFTAQYLGLSITHPDLKSAPMSPMQAAI